MSTEETRETPEVDEVSAVTARNQEVLPEVLPVLPLRNTVLFPTLVTPMIATTDRAKRVVEEALKRASAYHEAGADAILCHSKIPEPTDVVAFMNEWGDRCPVVIVPTMYSGSSRSNSSVIRVPSSCRRYRSTTCFWAPDGIPF